MPASFDISLSFPVQLFRLLRIDHWIKNLFVFTPLFFAGAFFDLEKLFLVFLGFVCFSLVASSIYILNDLVDLPFDKKHPEKRHRPLASGGISVSIAYLVLTICCISGLILAYLIKPEFLYLLCFYFTLNLVYSKYLKHIPVIDINCIAIGFVLRVLSGGILADILVSKWLVLMTFLLSLFLALAKRRDDLLLQETSGKKMRKSISGYNLSFISQSMMLMAAVMVVGYMMYVNSPEITSRFDSPYLYFSVFFVITGVLRYLQITFVEENTGSPTKILLKDRFTQLNLVAWILFFFYMLYL